MSGPLERLGIELPLVQAGMGGGAATPELAAAVSEAGGLGTLGTEAPELARPSLLAARELTGKPLAFNLLLPFTRREHREAAAEADLVVTFWGRPERPAPVAWLHQCGSVPEARAARAAGCDGVIAQGVEAGGHVRGELPATELLERVRAELPGLPVWLAGGVADGGDVDRALAAGAEAAVLGTRFLLTRESGAHPGYKQRVLEARETVLTELFGMGWPAPHRVVPNGATQRWLRRDPRGPGWLRAINRVTRPLASRVSGDLHSLPGRAQRPGLPFLSPLLPTEGVDERLLDASPLYAGESALRIHDLPPTAEVVRDLARRAGA